MIITIIAISILVIGIVMLIIDHFVYGDNPMENGLRIAGFIHTLVGVFGMLIVIGGIINANVGAKLEYQQLVVTRESLVYRLGDQDGNDIEIRLVQEINEFNVELIAKQYWATNLWTNWFNNQLVLDIEPIPLN